ncbi:MAG: AMP-binding protein [Rhodospirillales bacterium]
MDDLQAALARRAASGSTRTAFDDGAVTLTYRTLGRRVAAASERLSRNLPGGSVVGLYGEPDADWVVGQLAGWHAGMTVVPLPTFFRPAQLRHVIRDARVSHLLATADAAHAAAALGVPFNTIDEQETAPFVPNGASYRQIVYTSGSTGAPKGVVLGPSQLMWSARSLAQTIGASDGDTYLSVLPLAVLLETICAVVIPILVGAPVRLEPALAGRFGVGDGQALADAVNTHRPTCMVLVPDLLASWIAALKRAKSRAPDSLRFVAVGGAPLSPQLADEAWRRGVPVHEGYGLSECGSVVALNRLGERRAGTVGRPLPGLDVSIDEGEIVVRGPPVMERYVCGAPAAGFWRTGDLGAIGDDGVLTVHGRLDNVIVTPIGRNISPEWIETLIADDARVGSCVVAHFEGPHLTAIIVPAAGVEHWFATATADDLAALIATACIDVPEYALPRQVAVVSSCDVAPTASDRRRAVLDAYAAMPPCAATDAGDL